VNKLSEVPYQKWIYLQCACLFKKV